MSGSEQSIVSDDERENDLERVIENDEQGGAVEVVEAENGSDNENKENKEKKVVKPKRVVRNLRPKLNIDTLRGPKGLSCLENYFKNIKFKGNGHEAEDLRMIMKSYEYWCHRLFPKYPFDECLGKIEKLGSKNNVQTYLKRIRLGMDDFGTSKAVVSDEEDEHQHTESSNDQLFNTLTAERLQTDEPEEQELTEEQLERIRINKERAQQLRKERLQKLQEKADLAISQSNVMEICE